MGGCVQRERWAEAHARMDAGAADPGSSSLDLAGGGTAASSIGRPWRFCRGEGERDVRPVRERRKRRVAVARYSPVARKRRGGELIWWLPAARQTRTAGFGSSGRRVGLKQRRQRRSKTRASAAMQHEDGSVEARGGLHGESRRGALLLASAWTSSGSWFEWGREKIGAPWCSAPWRAQARQRGSTTQRETDLGGSRGGI